MTITKKQSNTYLWIALIIIAVASLMPGQSGRQTYGRQAQGGIGPCSAVADQSYIKGFSDVGLKCAPFLYDNDQQITFEQARGTYSTKLCDLKCYDCANEGSPVGKQVCFSSTTQTSTGITGEPASGIVTYSNGDDWIAAQITIKNTLSDPIAGILSLEITTEEEIAARKGFGPSFSCESKEDIQKTFSIDAGKTETTTLTSTNLPKGEYIVNIISVNKCCKYGCEGVVPFKFGEESNKIALSLPGKITPTYTCGEKDGQCKSSADDGNTKISGTCPSNQKCYSESKTSQFLAGFSFGSFGEWWNDRESWQKIAIVVGAFFVVSLFLMFKDRQSQT